jgi:hypothetical protein
MAIGGGGALEVNLMKNPGREKNTRNYCSSDLQYNSIRYHTIQYHTALIPLQMAYISLCYVPLPTPTHPPPVFIPVRVCAVVKFMIKLLPLRLRYYTR